MSAPPPPPAPARAWLAAPAGDWQTLSAAMTAEVPADRRPPGPGRLRPRRGPGRPRLLPARHPGHRGRRRPAGGRPRHRDPASPADRERYPVTWGALIHECAHAAHTQVRLPHERRANWCQAARQLEESRIEAPQAARRPGDRRWLRATATKLILADFTAAGAEPASPREAGAAAALLLAREDAGILEPAETAPVAAKVEAAIGTAALDRLRATWREFHATADDDLRTRTTLARRWCRILGLDPDAAPPAPLIITIPSELAKALARAIEVIAEAVAADFTPPPPPSRPHAADKREHEKAVRGNAERAAREVFGRKTRPRAVTGTRDPRDERDRRRPPPHPRAARGHRRRPRHRHRHLGGPARPPPHGQGPRLPGAARRRRRSRPPSPSPAPAAAGSPPRRCGSGSPATSPAPWAPSPARSPRPPGSSPARPATCPRPSPRPCCSARASHALTRPGETPAQVTDFTATASTESACRAIDALDGALGLASPGTARLLVIVSDAMFVAPGEPAGVQQRITRLHRAGCGVIILTPRGYAAICKYTDCQVTEAASPADAIDAIARAATRALTA